MSDKPNELPDSSDSKFDAVVTWVAESVDTVKAAMSTDFEVVKDYVSLEAQGASDKVTETQDLVGDLVLTELEEAKADIIAGYEEWLDSVGDEADDLIEWIEKEGEAILEEAAKDVEIAKEAVGKGVEYVIGMTEEDVEEAAEAIQAAKNPVTIWVDGVQEIITEATDLGWSWLAARVEDLLEIPARVIINLFCDYFFPEESD